MAELETRLQGAVHEKEGLTGLLLAAEEKVSRWGNIVPGCPYLCGANGGVRAYKNIGHQKCTRYPTSPKLGPERPD